MQLNKLDKIQNEAYKNVRIYKDKTKAGEERKLQLNKLDKIQNEAYKNARIYKDETENSGQTFH